jgi:hypothetical protein
LSEADNQVFEFTFLWWAKKSTQKTQPCAAAFPEPSGFRGGVKNSLYNLGETRFATSMGIDEAGRLTAIYPLKQFAPVFHGNRRFRAASQWASKPISPHRVIADIPYPGCCNCLFPRNFSI